jgi:hypothetical protein
MTPSSVPARISATEAGVDITASTLPRSHSRATTSAVSMVPMMVMMMATAPGTSARRLSRPALNMGVLTGAAGADDSASPLDARHNMEDETYR